MASDSPQQKGWMWKDDFIQVGGMGMDGSRRIYGRKILSREYVDGYC